MPAPIAAFGHTVARGLLRETNRVEDLDDGNWWAVTLTFEGDFRAFAFSEVAATLPASEWQGPWPEVQRWETSMTEQQYEDAVQQAREEIARGWIYQANICRILRQRLPERIDDVALFNRIRAGNPAPYAGMLSVPSAGVHIVSASPELFLSRAGSQIRSAPIKGTAATREGFLAKDFAENVMIVDLVRNDLAKVCEPGSVQVPDLLRIEEHPGLAHLVSDVVGELKHNSTWAEILAATAPAGSVSGAPKSSALQVIHRLETAKRGIYCGAFGWIKGDKGVLAVGIRTFWQEQEDDNWYLKFGTGSGITWGSDPAGEWRETQLKAARLFQVLADGS